ncbi:MAG: hypothetical protein JWP46_1844 [Modestobacter sp.]|nr:hypothetical protein [Modestobacter sp.]
MSALGGGPPAQTTRTRGRRNPRPLFSISVTSIRPTIAVDLAVVGIDVFAPALELARGNLAAEDMAGRVELRLQDAASLDEPKCYDVIWLPMPFLPAGVVPAVLATAVRSLCPGG